MTTYICKCGRTFQKNTEAGTTGFRMPDYGSGHECYGCPFICKIKTWDPVTQQSAVQNHECRGSKTLQYDTQAALSRGDKCVGRVYSLDLEFLHRVRDFADTLDGIEPDRYAFSDRPADYGDDGRFRLTIYPAQNNKGSAAKQRLFERFFNPDGARKDVTPEQEKEIVLNQIKEAKAMVQGKTAPAETGKIYYHNNLVYFADQREDSKKFTVFMDDADHPCPSTRTEVATIPDFEAFDEAQNALNGLALKRGFTTERSAGGEEPKKERPDTAPADEAPETGNNEADSEDGVDETPDSGDDSGNSVNDQPEEQQGPCDWKNASGADEDEPEEVSGDPLSLRGPEFDAVITTADGVLNRLVAMLHEKKQRDGEMTIKVTFEDADGMGAYIFSGAVSGKINYTVKPQKIVGDAVELRFDAQGNPIIPADREHQISFDEIQPGQREIPPTGTATVDGKTGIVESYQENAAEDQVRDDPQDDLTEEDEKLYPCENFDCPFYGLPDVGDAGCCYNQDARDVREPSIKSDVVDAVHFYRCTRPEVIQAFAEAHPDEDTDLEGDPDAQEDQPPYADGEEINQEDDAS